MPQVPESIPGQLSPASHAPNHVRSLGATEFVAPMSIMDKRRGHTIQPEGAFWDEAPIAEGEGESRIDMHPIGNERVIADAHQPTAPGAHF